MKTDLEVVLTKLRSSHTYVRRDGYTGRLITKPRVGGCFEMDTIEEGLFITTPITTLRFLTDTAIEFDTANSTYRIDYLRKREDGGEIGVTPLEKDVLNVFFDRQITGHLAIIGTLRDLVNKLLGRHA